jgi:hypothetical protein
VQTAKDILLIVHHLHFVLFHLPSSPLYKPGMILEFKVPTPSQAGTHDVTCTYFAHIGCAKMLSPVTLHGGCSPVHNTLTAEVFLGFFAHLLGLQVTAPRCPGNG